MKGRKLGNYEIIDKLGEGGMGEVWRGRDTRLGRSVALKVLPPELANDPNRRQRFEAEARAVGQLNHPNIVAVYDVGQQDGLGYMVSELVDGESLRALINRGPLPLRKLVDLGAQIADGLAAAHGSGIIHRDLKPENIMVTREGRAKILDFGLAKQTVKPTSDDTTATALSEPGVVMGTVGYMSPEQVRSQPVDPRSDIFSFGCILYELATGKRAFQGNSAVDVMSAILNSEPAELLAGNAAVAPALDTIIRRCLEKRPDQRFQSASDLAFALRSIASLSGSQPSQPGIGVSRRTSWLRAAMAAAGAIVLVAAGYFLRDRTASTNPPTFERLTFRQGDISAARFSSDSRSVLYAAAWDGGTNRVYLVSPGNPESRDLQMPDGGKLLSVSVKSDLALLVGPFGKDGAGTLAQNAVTGGQTRPMLEDVYAAEWSPDGGSMAMGRKVNGKWRVEYPVGKVLWEGEWPPYGLRISPDGERVAFGVFGEGSSLGIMTVTRSGQRKFLDILSGQITTVVGTQLAWRPDGREIWLRFIDKKELGTIWLTPERKAACNWSFARRQPARYFRRRQGANQHGCGPRRNPRRRRRGHERELSILDSSDLKDISRDGRWIVANVRGASGGPRGSIYLRGTDGSPSVRVGDGSAFAFSPDGKWLTGYTSSDSAMRKYVLMPTGTGEEKSIAVPGLQGNAGIIVGWLSGDQHYLVLGALREEGMAVLLLGPGGRVWLSRLKGWVTCCPGCSRWPAIPGAGAGSRLVRLPDRWKRSQTRNRPHAARYSSQLACGWPFSLHSNPCGHEQDGTYLHFRFEYGPKDLVERDPSGATCRRSL
jgi:serine/threonine protein kinase